MGTTPKTAEGSQSSAFNIIRPGSTSAAITPMGAEELDRRLKEDVALARQQADARRREALPGPSTHSANARLLAFRTAHWGHPLQPLHLL